MKAIDLFSGIGGLSLGFQNAGFKIISAFDNWQAAVDIYKANFEHDVLQTDLSRISNYQPIKNLKPDVIIGGPPCQDFSCAGKRNEKLGRADLTITFANIVSNVKPILFVMENVERITKSYTLQKAIKIFKKAGYGITSKVLNASLCGVPQIRKRFFLIGFLNGEDNILDYYLTKNLSKKPMSVYDYLGDNLGIEYYYRHPWSYARRAIFSIHEPSPTIRGVNRPIPKTYKTHSGDATDIIKNVRPLTTIERSYIQTFPKSFKLNGTKTDLEQMIGNAVPVKLAEYVAKAILKYYSDYKSDEIKNKSYQLQLKFN
ncbi:DNA-cytosine methyltransferase [Desulfonema limicola]|uniref:Cytosine-specific methyltransferase n=1 Tax=Desulfonema limicola TaxID=45656 RepID=A0A975BE90_9BACT|nr:DNA cytosine methyltransferase [Desulfonema limicola]QTA83675.1 DNA-cytosine methyltransferase [Desulfonema limicola]